MTKLSQAALLLAIVASMPAIGSGQVPARVPARVAERTESTPPASPYISLDDSYDSEPASFDAMLSDLEDRVKKSEETFREFAETQNKKWHRQEAANTSVSKALKQAVVSGTSGTKSMKIVGRIHADYWSIPDSDDGINLIETGDVNTPPQAHLGFRRVRFGVRGDVNDLMEYRIEMEFGGGNNSEFRDAWLGFKEVGSLGKVRIGNQKRPYGLDQLNSSNSNVFLERPFVVDAFNQDARRLGIVVYNNTEDLAWNWRYGVYNQRLIQDEGNYISNHVQGEIAGRLANTAWYDETSGGRGYAHWAVSGTAAHPDSSAGGDPTPLGSDRAQNEARFRHRPEARTVNRWLDTGRIAGADWYELLGVEGVLNVGPVQVVGEYENVWMQRNAGFQDLHLHGGYVYVSYFLTGEHMPWDRKSGTLGRVKPFENFFLLRGADGESIRGKGAWQVAARYSYADFNDKDILGGVGEAVTLGVNWYWNPNARMQFNYIFGSIDNRGLGNNGVVSGDYQILGTRMMIHF